KREAEVIYEAIGDIHSSGHACREELKLIHNLVRPDYFMPVHGEFRHLKRQADLAQSIGMKKKNIFIMDKGQVLEISEKKASINGEVASGYLMVDGLGVGDIGNIVLRDRKHLSQDGLITVVVTVEKASGEIIAGPDVITRGFVYVKESEELINEIKDRAFFALRDHDLTALDFNAMKNILRSELREFLYKKTKRRPMILPIIMEI
ncbi:MAG: ribonuclease J, partial [Clostridia bacterium]|nr:ribonuclease J [Clostridia bacterium]